MHADEYAYEFGEDLDLFMRYAIEDEPKDFTKEAFIAEFNKSLGATPATKLLQGKSVNYNDIVD